MMIAKTSGLVVPGPEALELIPASEECLRNAYGSTVCQAVNLYMSFLIVVYCLGRSVSWGG
jgi:hypothetical protein